MIPTPRSSRNAALVFPLAAAVALLLWALVLLAGAPLRTPAEGSFAEAARQLATDGQRALAAPPGGPAAAAAPTVVWLTTAAMRAIGPGDGSARLVPVLAALAGIGLVWLAAGWLSLEGAAAGRRAAGPLAAAVLAGSGLYVLNGATAGPAMASCVLMTLAVACSWQAAATGRVRYHLLWGAGAAGAALSGGIGAAAGALLALPLLEAQRGRLRASHPARWLLPAAVTVCLTLPFVARGYTPWLRAATVLTPSNLLWAVVALAAGMFGWLPALGAAPDRGDVPGANRFLWTWFWIGLAAAATGPPDPLAAGLLCLPPLAILTGRRWSAGLTAEPAPPAARWQLGSLAMQSLALVLAGAAALVLRTHDHLLEWRLEPGDFSGVLLAAGGGIGLCLWAARRRAPGAAFAAIVLSSALLTAGIGRGAAAISGRAGLSALAAEAAQAVESGAQAASCRAEMADAFRFYLGIRLGRTAAVVELGGAPAASGPGGRRQRRKANFEGAAELAADPEETSTAPTPRKGSGGTRAAAGPLLELAQRGQVVCLMPRRLFQRLGNELAAARFEEVVESPGSDVLVANASRSPVLEGAGEPPPPGKVAHVLRSGPLELRLRARPYSYALVERATGRLLVDHRQTTFSLGGPGRPVAEARDVRVGPAELTAALVLAGEGRPARVRFTFPSPEVLQVALEMPGTATGEIGEQFQDQGEHVYGIWEYPFTGGLDNRGADRAFLPAGLQPEVNHASARAPFYVTSRGYGAYVQTEAEGWFRIAVGGKTAFSFATPALRYQLLYGPGYGQVLARYNAAAGPAAMPPTWALGSAWWRNDAHQDRADGIRNAQESVLNDAEELARHRIPATAIWIDRPYGTGKDGWGAFDFDSSFPDPPRMARDLDARGLKLMLWVANRYWPAGRDDRRTGPVPFFTPGPRGPILDLREPDRRAWLRAGLERLGGTGVQGFKIDRGDEGDVPNPLENELATHMARVAADSLQPRYGADFFLFARNVCDTGRRFSGVWNGDSKASYDGLAVSIKNALRCGAMNFPMWGSDTGGYLAKQPPSKELLARWLAFSAYSPFMEVMSGPRRTVWRDYDAGLLAIARDHASTHHDLIPLTRSLLFNATRTGMPVMRPLIFAFPDDARFVDCWDEYLYGPDLLVAPVVTPGARGRTVNLPRGRWLDYNDRTSRYDGPSTLTVTAPLGTMPLFVREGAILPRGDVFRGNNRWAPGWAPTLRVELFPAAAAGSQFEYDPGEAVLPPARRPRLIRCLPDREGITIQVDDLALPAELQIYCRAVGAVKRGGVPLQPGRDYAYDSARQVLRVPVAGAAVLRLAGARSLWDR